jgi:proteasome component ECM29
MEVEGGEGTAALRTALIRPRSRLARLPAPSLAAALQLLWACLEADALRRGVPLPTYVRALDDGTLPSAGATLPQTGPSVGVLPALQAALELALAHDPAAPEAARLHEAAAAALARLGSSAPPAFCASYAGRLPWLTGLLRSGGARPALRRHVAALLGAASTALPLGGGDDAGGAGACVAGVVRELMGTLSANVGAARTLDAAHGALCGLGAVLERSLPRLAAGGGDAGVQAPLPAPAGSPAALVFDGALLADATAAVLAQLSHRVEGVREAATSALASIARAGVLPLPGGAGDAGSVLAAVGGAAPPAAGTGDASVPPPAPSTRADVVLALFHLATGRKPQSGGGGGGAPAAASTAPRVSFAGDTAGGGGGREDAGEVGGSSSGSAHSATTEAAAVCLGAIASGEMAAAVRGGAAGHPDGSPLPLPPIADAALAALRGLAVNRFEQVQFTVAAALVEAASGAPAALAATGAPGCPRPGAAVDDDPAASSSDADIFAAVGVAATGGGAPAAAREARAAMPPAEVALREAATAALLDGVLAGPLQSLRAQERAAAAIWLLSLTHALGATSLALRARLPLLQAAFSRLLGSEKAQFVQEVAAKGLALVYDAAGEDVGEAAGDGSGAGGATHARLRSQLVSSLLTGLDGSRRVGAAPAPLPPPTGFAAATPTAAAAATATAAGPAGLSLSAGGDASYRELCAMANEAGNPELVYRFLALSSHHALWHARGGAAYGLEALLSGRARAALEPHVAKLLPRLFRFQYDPHPRVRESMGRLWVALVRDPSAAVAAHVGPILRELVAASQAEAWREREGACRALSDVLPGRTAAELRPHLAPLWRAALRAIDDVKDSVREAGLRALRALGKATLRLCDPAQSSAKEGREVVGVMLPFLLGEGVHSPIKDAQAACLGYLRDIARAAGPLLRPHVPDLVAVALAGMSALERHDVAHLQMHVDAGTGMYGDTGGLTGEALEAARIGATR